MSALCILCSWRVFVDVGLFLTNVARLSVTSHCQGGITGTSWLQVTNQHQAMWWCRFVTRSHDVQVIPPWQSLVTLSSFHSRRRSDLKQRLGSPDYPVLQGFLLSDVGPVYSRENMFDILGTPVNFFWKLRGLQWKFVSNFGSRNYLKSDLSRPWTEQMFICIHVYIYIYIYTYI